MVPKLLPPYHRRSLLYPPADAQQQRPGLGERPLPLLNERCQVVGWGELHLAQGRTPRQLPAPRHVELAHERHPSRRDHAPG